MPLLSKVRSRLPEQMGIRTQLRWSMKWLREAMARFLRSMQRLFRTDIKSRIPIDEDQFVGPDNFGPVGEMFFKIFREQCALMPEDVVLDVGSGQGRMARPLANFLSPNQGEYHGLEIVKEGVEFCEKAYAKEHNFSIYHIPVYNSRYNPTGTLKASDYVFPFPDGRFSFVFLTSVFTHMLEPDVEQYCREIYRVLKPGGRALVTFYLLEPESLTAVRKGNAEPLLKHEYSEVCRIGSLSVPEAAIGCDHDFVVNLVESLDFAEPTIHLGSWARKGERLTWQDVVILRRECDGPSES